MSCPTYSPGDYTVDIEGVIAAGAFRGCPNITSVKIASTVTQIQENAFRSCVALHSVYIPDSVTNIGNYVFCDCTALTSVDLPDSIVSLGGQAFEGCTSLESVTLSNSLVTLNNALFRQCVSLKTIVIPDNITTIGSDVFDQCKNLTLVENGRFVRTIGSNAFRDCASLLSFPFGQDVSVIGNEAFCRCHMLTSLVLPDKIEKLDTNVFYSCKNLTSVSMPQNLRYINVAAFRYCEKLRTVSNMPRCLETIRSKAFSQCYSLEGIVIPSLLAWEDCFKECLELQYVTLGDNVTVKNIPNNIFEGDVSLLSFVIPDTVVTVGDASFQGCKGLVNVSFGKSVKSIWGGAFNNCYNLTSIIIPDAVQTLEGYTFANCRSAETLYLGKSLTVIKQQCFRYCWQLETVVFPDSLKEMHFAAFGSCSMLKSITLGRELVSIGESCFTQCKSLESLVIPSRVEKIQLKAFYQCGMLRTVEVVGSRVWGDSIFYECVNLTSITFGFNVTLTVLPNSVFERCYKLSAIDIPETVTGIKDSAFRSCSSLSYVYLRPEINLLGNNAFRSTGLVSFHFPESCSYAGDSLLAYCYSLKEVTYGTKNITLAGSVFSHCTNLSTVLDLPETIFAFGASTWHTCNQFVNVTIHDGITRIPNAAFYCCGNLKYLKLGKNVKVIDQYAFGYAALVECNLPDGVEYLGECSYLSSNFDRVIIPASVTTLEPGVWKYSRIGYMEFRGTNGPRTWGNSIVLTLWGDAVSTVHVPCDYNGTTFCRLSVTYLPCPTEEFDLRFLKRNRVYIKMAQINLYYFMRAI